MMHFNAIWNDGLWVFEVLREIENKGRLKVLSDAIWNDVLEVGIAEKKFLRLYSSQLFKWDLYLSWMIRSTIFDILMSHWLNLVILIREHKHERSLSKWK